jgi:hypothetical protein
MGAVLGQRMKRIDSCTCAVSSAVDITALTASKARLPRLDPYRPVRTSLWRHGETREIDETT